MNCPTDSSRKIVSLAISLLMLLPSVAIPLMERGELTAEVAVESGHDPSRCQHGHDHTVCTQVSANLSLSLLACQHRLGHVRSRVATPAAPRSVAAETFLEGPPSRAPPLA